MRAGSAIPFVFWFGGDRGTAAREAARDGAVPSHRSGHVLLASAMFALGLATRWTHMKAAGTKPLLLALIIFSGLVLGGWIMTRLLV